ncbi:MAG TPA: alpha/beta hydrolase [Clostridiales bacterium]|nr:alpha/beta hydrolase [Clostridiales bacterium]
MPYEKIALWSDAEKQVSSGSAFGTFKSCDPTLTYYPAESGAGRGTIIVCPGGGYAGKADHEGEPIALRLNESGINAYVLDYRVNPDLHPAPMLDARRAIGLARSRAQALGTRPDRIGIMGFSAGGHLAATAGTTWDQEKNRPDAMILGYPVITLGKLTHIGSRINLLGETADSTLTSDLSIENRVDRRTPPAFIWHTADDEAVPVENSLMLASSLAARQISFACYIYPHGRHGLGLAADQPDICHWPELCADFLAGLGF